MKWHFMNTKPSQERWRCYLEARKGSGFKPGDPHAGWPRQQGGGRQGEAGGPGGLRVHAGQRLAPDPGQQPPTVDQTEVKTVHVLRKTRKRT